MTKSKLQKFIETFNWVKNSEVPFAKLSKQLNECKVAIVSTGGVYEKTDRPFAIENSKDVDETYREINLNTSYDDLQIGHEHFNKEYASKDLNVVFPVQRLQELADEGFIKEVSEVNFSISGFIPKPEILFKSGKDIAKRMKDLNVDLALIVPV